MNFKIGLGFLLAAGIAVYVFVIAIQGVILEHVFPLLCITGGLLGWILGIFLTPLDRGEKDQFAEYGKAVSALVAGFVAGKIDDILGSSIVQSMMTDTPSVAAGTLAFIIFFGLGTLATFIGRKYVKTDEEKRQEQRRKAFEEVDKALQKLSDALK